jgi:hypothetical protein
MSISHELDEMKDDLVYMLNEQIRNLAPNKNYTLAEIFVREIWESFTEDQHLAIGRKISKWVDQGLLHFLKAGTNGNNWRLYQRA